MKGQASLEMVIGLIILLVVAAVVISLVIFYINPTKIKTPEQTLTKNEFLNNCKDYCNDLTTLDFCKKYYPGDDFNGNGVKNELIPVGTYEWQTCESRVYCFLAVPCEDRFGTGMNAITKCKQVLCQAYMEKYSNNRVTATTALKDTIDVATSCPALNAVTGADNWYTSNGGTVGNAITDGC